VTPVDQTITDDGKGNCFASCVASLLDLPLSDVPNFVEAADMDAAARNWLAERGYVYVRLCFPDPESLAHTYFESGMVPIYCILSGISPRVRADGSPKWHAVVGQVSGYGIKIAHDPHPSRAGLKEDGHRWVSFLVPAGVPA
jgi:hypothetical protein